MDTAVALEARRLLDRYLIEVVEAFELCPWAASARRRGEIRVAIVGEGPHVDAQVNAAIDQMSADESVAIGMVVLAAAPLTPSGLRRLRDRVLEGRRDVAIADFHPEAAVDLTSAARLVPFLRRSPDPMLQVVPHRVLASVKRTVPSVMRSDQLAMLAGLQAPAPSIADKVADTNKATVVRVGPDVVAAVIEDIRRDRDHTYARLGRGADPGQEAG
jgi:hypothetical protein